ncbi:MAG: hypothetical protein ACYC1I_01900 [Acidimicrobiales bacterium]
MGPEESSNERSPRQFLFATQLFFFATLLLCLLIVHSEIVENDGISFFGVYHRTIEILAVGFFVAAYGLWRTSSYFRSVGAPALLVVGLRVVAISLFVLLITPFDKGTFLNWAHMITGVAMALVELAITILLLVKYRGTASIGAFSVALGGGLLAAVSLPDWSFAYLFQGEVIYEVGFAWCLLEWTRIFEVDHREALAEQC